jgi:phosphatidylglycerophosphate synthase
MSIINKIYPLEIRNREILSPVLILIRVTSLPLFFLLVLFRFSPNFVSLISSLTLILSGIFASLGDFFISSIFMYISISLDCADGQIARYKNKQSIFGQKLESINGDLALLIYPLSVSIGLFNSGLVSIWVVLLTALSSSIYVNWRGVLSISSINDDPNGLTFLKRIIYSQQKPNENVRDKSLIGKILFILRMNTATQAGIPLYLIIIFLFFSPSSAVFPLQILIISQLFIGLALMVGKLVMKSE